jgi:tripartite-type tricarboxylate transporter receptor subunit TctC
VVPVDPSLASVWQGKTVTITVGFVAGGGNDTWARLFARHLGKQLPGNPTVIVENVPGAGGIVQATTSTPPDRTGQTSVSSSAACPRFSFEARKAYASM